MSLFSKIKVGVVSFTETRQMSGSKARELYTRKKHLELVSFLKKKGFEVVDPMPIFRKERSEIFGLNKREETFECARFFNGQNIDCLVIGCWHWTDIYLPVQLVTEVNCPVALYTEDDPAWAGSVYISALSASLREVAPNRSALVHKRIKGNKPELYRWIKGVGALQKLRVASLMLWGGDYPLRMEHLRDDYSYLKSFLVGEILSEGQYILIRKAEDILASQSERVDSFLKWLRANKAKVIYDKQMCTSTVLQKQAALYLAAKDRLKELKGENIVGVSVKCQPEVNTFWGVNACFLPAFLPFPWDSEGKKEIVPTVCEGDIKSLITSCLLYLISGEVPPMFGDVRYIGDKYWVLSNCGATSIFYASYSLNPLETLSRVTIRGNCHGISGAAVGYLSPPATYTLARLIRIQGKYFMQLGLGQVMKTDEKIQKKLGFGSMWPISVLKMTVDPELFFEIIGSNHFCAILGDISSEMTFACQQAAIPIVRIDSEEELRRAMDDLVQL